jgi:SAM-dependent methyltransferase
VTKSNLSNHFRRKMPLKTLQYYEQNAKQIAPTYEDADLSNVYRMLKQLFVIPSRLLELGGGSGRDAAFLLGQGHDLFFSDASRLMILEAIRLHPELTSRALVCKADGILPFVGDCFDGVVAIAVLMHLTIPAIIQSMSEMHRVVKPGGTILISVPASRDDLLTQTRDQQGRLMTAIDIPALATSDFSGRFALVSETMNSDGLDRGGIRWHTCCLIKT